MNKKFKFLTVLLALVMTLGAFAPFSARAEGEGEKEGTKKEATTTETVTLHKVLMDKESFGKVGKNGKTVGENGEKYDTSKINDIAAYFGGESKEIEGVYFAWAKKDTDGNYYWIKDDGNFTKTKTEVNEKELDKLPADTFGGKTVKDKGIKFTTTNFKGEYKIYEIHAKSSYKGEAYVDKDGNELVKTSEGKYFKKDDTSKTNEVAEKDVIKVGTSLTDMKAVPVVITLPVVTENGIVKDVHVYPKNIEDIPKIDKNFAKVNDLKDVDAGETGSKVGADYANYQKKKATVSADLGKQIPYEVKTRIPKDSHYKKLVWNDNMTKGLTYQRDLEITSDQLTGDNALKVEDYFVTETDRGFTLVFKESGLTKVENAAKAGDVEIKLTYSAKINGEAVVDKPELNDIALDYSNKPGKDSEPKEFTPGKKEITMKKSWDVTGDQTITEADKNVVAYFTLQKKNTEGKWEDVKTVEKTAKEEFTVVFDNLDENGTYRIVESVKGYEADYQKYNPETGVIEIKDHKDTDNPERLNPTEPKVQLGGRRFVKTSEDKNERLAGAEFYVKKTVTENKTQVDKYLVATKKDAEAVKKAKDALDKAVKTYNALDADKQTDEEKAKVTAAQEAYNKAFKENATEYTWGEKDNPNVVVLTSDGQGQFEITGLEYGTYYLEEKTAPKGFAKLDEAKEFKVFKDSYDGKADELDYKTKDAEGKEVTKHGQQVINKKYTIPQTGGIGTVIFTVVGVMLMVGAAFALKRRKEDELEGLA